jgi:S1-C subfamily serine protease
MLAVAGFLIYFVILPGGAWIKRQLETERTLVKGEGNDSIEESAAKDSDNQPATPVTPPGNENKDGTVVAAKPNNPSRGSGIPIPPPSIAEPRPGAQIDPGAKAESPDTETVRTIVARIVDFEGVAEDDLHLEKSDLSSKESAKYKALSQARWLGLRVRDLSGLDQRTLRSLSGSKGILIAEVSPASPASKGGIRKGDVLRSIGGKTMMQPEDVDSATSGFKPEQTVTAVVMRPTGGTRYERKELKVTVEPVVPERAVKQIAALELSVEIRDCLIRHVVRYATLNNRTEKSAVSMQANLGKDAPKPPEAIDAEALLARDPFDESYRPAFGTEAPIRVGNIGVFRQATVEAIINRTQALVHVQRAYVVVATDTTNLIEREPADLGAAQIVAAIDVTTPKESSLSKVFFARPFDVDRLLPDIQAADTVIAGKASDGEDARSNEKERKVAKDAFAAAAANPTEVPPKNGADRLVRSVTDVEVTNLEREAMKCRSAADAVDLYREFMAFADLSEKQKNKVLDRQKVWQERVAQHLVRLGTEWVSLDQARATAKLADDLIGQAFGRIKEGDYKRAKDLLEKAIRQDPSGVRADWYLGMLNSPNFWNYALAAENNFERAHKRDPENPGISNNLALSKIKMGHWGEALDSWADALRFAPEAPEAVHNLGRFVKEASAKRIRVGAPVMKRASKLYEKALAQKKGPPSNEKTGWLYSPLALSANERERAQPAVIVEDDDAPNGKPEAKQKARRTFCGSGTGFVISPGYVLSNRHVAAGGTSFRMRRPGQDVQEHEATLVALCDDHDLALFKCEALPAAAVPLNIELPRRASEVMVLGFPFGNDLGDSLKSVRGTVFGFDNGSLLINAMVNPGNSGGPICNESGQVVAVIYAKRILKALDPIGSGELGYGIPVAAAMPFLTKMIADLQPVGDEPKLGWPEVDERIGASVVMVKMYVENLPIFGNPPTSKTINPFEDCTCTACKGRSKVPCPVTGCFKGSVAEFEASYMVSGVGAGAQVLQWPKPRDRACPGCRGAGVIDCPHCKDGLDLNLR